MSVRSKLFYIFYREYRFKSSNRNPGIEKRIKIFSQENPEIESLNINESNLENNESDFYNASNFYEQHLSEERKLRKIIEYKRIERKFFSTIKYPNLLTWSEKEQIRHLFQSNPSTWTPEKLALSFPATADVIKKILKSQWAPINPERIRHHDKAVSDNWKAINKGEIKLPESFESHLKNFISRREITKVKDQGKAISSKKEGDGSSPKQPKLSEFASIITSFKIKKETENISSINVENGGNSGPHYERQIHSSETYVPNKNKYCTLEELRRETEKSFTKNSLEPSEVDKHFIKGTCKSSIKEGSLVDMSMMKEIPLPRHKLEKTKGHTQPELEEDNIVLKINIPDGKNKKGGIYKVKDCYYDDNGDFLYKVPEMP